MFVCIFLSAQQPPEIEKSTEKVLLNGKVYFLHVIQAGQTVYSIARAYNVTTQDIIVANPGVDITQVKTGSVLRVPETPDETQQEVPDLEDEDFIYHKVKQGHTLYSISKKYDLPIEVIYSYNPEAEHGLKTGATLKIPKKKVLKEVIEAIRDDNNFYYYEVKKKDTLYNISKQYNVTIGEIIDLNPELRWGLKTGQTIKIPKRAEQVLSHQLPADTIIKDTVDFLPAYTCDTLGGVSRSKVIKLAVLLPFMADQVNRITAEDTVAGVNVIKNLRNTSGYFDFYQGMLVALDTLQKEGFNISLHVYDTKSDTNEVKRILSRLRTDIPDVIMGPVYPENIKLVLDFASLNNVPVISPFYNRNEQLRYYKKILQVTPSREVERDAILKYVSNFNNENVILVHSGDTVSNNDLSLFRKGIYKLNSNGTSINFKEVINNDTIRANLPNVLDPARKNIIIVLSDNSIYVNGVLSKLDLSSKRYNITVIGQPSWMSFQTINIEYYHNLEVTLFTPFYINYSTRATKNFLKKYRNFFGTEPTTLNSIGINWAYLGYDVTNYLVNVYYQYGSDFYGCLPYFNHRSLLTEFSFSQHTPQGGYENNAINVIRFEKTDFEVKREEIIKNSSKLY